MAVFYAIGEALVGKNELHAKIGSGELRQFQEALSKKPNEAKLNLLTGTATAKNIVGSFDRGNGSQIGFEEIGIGKPLTVQIRHIYTGNKAEGFWGDKDMLVTSAMRSISTYDAAPRAVNYLVPSAQNNRNFRTVNATEKGTPLICYSPSLTQPSSVVTVEVMFSGFPKETFDAVAQAFNSASSIPVFAPASGYLVAAGLAMKLAGNIGKSLVDGTPALRRTEEITFVTPGSNKATANFILLISDEVSDQILANYRVTTKGILARMDDENKLYDGEFPYVVISLDGREVDEYKMFSPTAATAAQLDKFYNINDGSSQPLGTIVDALKLYNDMKFREKASNIAENLKAAVKGSEQYNNMLVQYQAYVNNIQTKELKPSTLE
ncbi:MAG: hypothetical protein H8K11_15425 [Nitrospira sp.]|nr:hypothetical protein [Nitrospira sp.]